jgi:DNA-binding response OmpR family regulator
MSGYLKDSDVKHILAEGVDDFIRKPFKMEEIREKVYKLLGIA